MPEQRIASGSRERVVERANGCREYCHSQERFATQPFSVNHVVVRAKGGMTTIIM
jgi:hypothetical protein